MGDYRNGLRLPVRLSICLSFRNTFLSAPYLLNPLKDFHFTLVKCSPQWVDVQNPCQPCQPKVKVRSRSWVWVLNFVSAPSPIPLEGFSLNFGHMFTSVRQFAELIIQPCWHKVKVTVQGHRFEPWISCPLCISYTSGRIFFKLWSNVHLSEMMCRINNSTMPTQGQGRSSRSWVWALNFVSTLYLLYPWEDFL